MSWHLSNLGRFLHVDESMNVHCKKAYRFLRWAVVGLVWEAAERSNLCLALTVLHLWSVALPTHLFRQSPFSFSILGTVGVKPTSLLTRERALLSSRNLVCLYSCSRQNSSLSDQTWLHIKVHLFSSLWLFLHACFTAVPYAAEIRIYGTQSKKWNLLKPSSIFW